MKTSSVFTGVLLTALLVSLTQCCPCCAGDGTSTPTPTTPPSKITTRSFGGGDVTLKGDEEQLNKIADVELVPESDSRYPQPQDIASDVTKIISVFEIKLKTGIKSVAPPSITIESIYVGQKGVDLKNLGLAHLPLPIHRFDPSTGTWPKAGEARLKSDPEWASGTIEKASLLAIVSTAEIAVPEQLSWEERQARIFASVKQVITIEEPQTVSILFPAIWGAEAPPYGKIAESAAASFMEQGIEVRSESVSDITVVRERILAERAAGTLADCFILIGVIGDLDALRETMAEIGVPLYIYNDESGYLDKQ